MTVRITKITKCIKEVNFFKLNHCMYKKKTITGVRFREKKKIASCKFKTLVMLCPHTAINYLKVKKKHITIISINNVQACNCKCFGGSWYRFSGKPRQSYPV